jgi:aminoacyl tRNA synthase complex-interacting multifunctional protein 1
VLCASNDAHDVVEPLAPPADAPAGERVFFGEAGRSQVGRSTALRGRTGELGWSARALYRVADVAVCGWAQGAPAEPNRVQKKKLWEAAQPLLKTNGEAFAQFKDQPMLTSAGPVRAASLANAAIA